LYLGGAQFAILAGTPASLAEVFLGFPQSLEANVRKVPQLVNDHIIPNPFQLTIYLSFNTLPINGLQFVILKAT
jgi:hypothetical protein